MLKICMYIYLLYNLIYNFKSLNTCNMLLLNSLERCVQKKFIQLNQDLIIRKYPLHLVVQSSSLSLIQLVAIIIFLSSLIHTHAHAFVLSKLRAISRNRKLVP